MFNFPDTDMTDLKDSVKKARRVGKKLGWKLAEDVEADYALGDPELCKKYALGDVERTLKLYKAYEGMLTQPQHAFSPYSHYKAIADMEHELLPIVREMSRKGVAIDAGKVQELETYYRGCIEKATAEKAALGFPALNPESPQQVIEVFYNQLGAKAQFRKRKAKDGSKSLTKSADKNALVKWSKDIPLARVLVELSEAQHQLNSFILPFKENSYDESGYRTLHPSFNTCGPVTGRLSCSAPNLQNITASNSPGRKSSVEFRARECFTPRKGHTWLLVDYSQVEIWVAAFLSKDTLMVETLLAGNSVHDLTCDRVFGHKTDFASNRPMYRKFAKIVNFSMLYGSGPKALAELLAIDESDAKEYWKGFWDTYTGMGRYNEMLKRTVKTDGHVKDVFGRPYFVEAKFAYKALNYMVQGTAAGILKRAMIEAYKHLKATNPAVTMLLTIHDELVFEVPNNCLNSDLVWGIERAMAGNFHTLLGMPTPFKVESSVAYENWSKKTGWEAKETHLELKDWIKEVA
jgi:DNA polymerase-1